MVFRSPYFSRALGILLALLATGVSHAQSQRVGNVEVDLIAQSQSIAAGETIWVGLRIKHDPHWHTYWKNPGDSGLVSTLDWTLPEGVSASEIIWPAPKRIPLGPLINFGYEGDLLLPLQLSLAVDHQLASPLQLKAKATWLMCEEICIPGEAEFELLIPIANKPAQQDPRWQALFKQAMAAIPQAVDWPATVALHGDQIRVKITADAATQLAEPFELFAVNDTLTAAAPGSTVRNEQRELLWQVAKNDYFTSLPKSSELILVSSAGAAKKSYSVQIIAGELNAAEFAAFKSQSYSDTTTNNDLSYAVILLFALLGGILLNLMPCVFPVLALKALALSQHSADLKKARQHGLLYTAGVVLSLTALGGALLALRSAGEAIGWGFQLQLPWVVASLAYLMTALGLSLSGVYMIGGSWMNAGAGLVTDNSARSAFFTGVLAVIVASPCTAPMMGPALGAAVSFSAPLALLVFAMLGLGLALPMLLISWSPKLAQLLPKPGAWMDGFKQLMAFPLYLTAIWLLWVLGAQSGTHGMAQAMLGLLALSFALWLIGRSRRGAWHYFGVAIAAGLALWAIMDLPQAEVAASSASNTEKRYEAWSPERLQALRDQGRPVLVNMTAAWCISCLANERVALSSDAFYQTLADLNYVYLKGDWTRRDSAITQYLAQFGRNGVPLYVVYAADGSAPVVLPQLLTPASIDEALRLGAAKK